MILWLTVFHLLFMVAWFASLLYLPRLFVYHAQAEDEISIERFKVMERRLYHGIMTPASLLTLVFGLWLASLSLEVYIQATWFWIKVGLVFLLFGYQGMCGRIRRNFENDSNTLSHTFYRWFNEVPSLFLFFILVLVIVKPF